MSNDFPDTATLDVNLVFQILKFSVSYYALKISEVMPIDQRYFLFQCMEKFGINPAKQEMVDKCANSVLGQTILHGIGLETKSLEPSLTFIPWIVINGVSQ